MNNTNWIWIHAFVILLISVWFVRTGEYGVYPAWILLGMYIASFSVEVGLFFRREVFRDE